MQPQLTIIVYGPKACGKTRNAERLRKGFDLDTIIDDWNGRDEIPKRGALVLTDEATAFNYGGRAHRYDFAEAMEMVAP